MKIKKLVLNKKTIANLYSNEMNMMKGGMIRVAENQSILYPTCYCKTSPSQCLSHCNDCPAGTGVNGGLDTEVC
jgi:natural product precursor